MLIKIDNPSLISTLVGKTLREKFDGLNILKSVMSLGGNTIYLH